jgi:rhodanese-related sulfurtransferase
MSSPIVEPGFASPEETLAHYSRRLTLETDCADVFVAMQSGDAGFVLVDTRNPAAYAERHVPGAVSIPNAEMTAERLAGYPPDTRFVTYCWGPHCNGACKGAANLARLGYRAKEMLGGMWGWEMEGYPFSSQQPAAGSQQ